MPSVHINMLLILILRMLREPDPLGFFANQTSLIDELPANEIPCHKGIRQYSWELYPRSFHLYKHKRKKQ